MSRTALTTAQKIDTYVRLRDHKSEADKEFKKSMERVNAAMEKLEAELLEELQNAGVTSQKSDFGTVYIREVSNMRTTDRDALLKFALKNKDLDMLDIRPNKSAIQERMTKGEHVDGVEVTTTKLIGVRRGTQS